MERQLKVPQGRTLGRASESPGMDSLARSWRSSPWLQHLQGSLEHAPAASACSADCCALPAARRSRAVDIVDIFLQRIDGNRKRLEEASGSARASTGCNHRPSGTSGGPCGPAGAIGGVCACVPGVGPGGSFTTLRMGIPSSACFTPPFFEGVKGNMELGYGRVAFALSKPLPTS